MLVAVLEMQWEMVLGPQNLRAKVGADVASYGSKGGFIGIPYSSEEDVLHSAVLLPLTTLCSFPFAQYISRSILREDYHNLYLAIQV